MRPSRTVRAVASGLAGAALVALAVAFLLPGRPGGPEPAAAPPRDAPLPPGVDTAASLDEVAARMAACESEPDAGHATPDAGRAGGASPDAHAVRPGASPSRPDEPPDRTPEARPFRPDGPLDRTAAGSGPGPHPCAGLVYVWSPRMPLSRLGIGEIVRAAETLELPLHVVGSAELTGRAGAAARPPPDAPDGGATDSGHRGGGPRRAPSPGDALALRMIAAGATLHAPSVTVLDAGRPLGGALLGYKTADAWTALLGTRLAGGSAPGDEASGALRATPAADLAAAGAPELQDWRDFPVDGRPGAYFRWVPGRNAVAYEAGSVVYLLDLASGRTSIAPGTIDFVPSPDGRLFVTPGRGRAGLEFYDAEAVFDAASQGRGRSVGPVYNDPRMRDQYPSVGILSAAEGSGRTVYRVLTSWFDQVVYRDYEVRWGGRGPLSVRPLGDPVAACSGLRVSIPIMAPDGREVAARDEATATTKVFRIDDGGRCTEVQDLGLQTGKVAWRADGRRLAFAIPEGAVRDGQGLLFRGEDAPGREGVFVFDRGDASVQRVEGSEDARRLTFPDFVGDDRVVFLLPPEERRGGDRFRLVCCVR